MEFNLIILGFVNQFIQINVNFFDKAFIIWLLLYLFINWLNDYFGNVEIFVLVFLFSFTFIMLIISYLIF